MTARLRKALAWYMRVRRGYLAPETRERVRCTRGDSVIYGVLYSDSGSWVQVVVEGNTLVTLHRGPWLVETV